MTTTDTKTSPYSSEATWAFLTLRLFLALRWIISAIEKYELNGEYSFENYYTNMRRMAEGIASESIFPGWATLPYAYSLGHVTMLVGILLLLGVKTSWMLVANALLYVSLAAGMMAVEENAGVAWLAIHIALSVWALLLVKHNRLALTRD